MHRIKNKVTAIILAAGKGTRFGGDKLLHEIKVETNPHEVSKKHIGLISALNVKPHVDEVICVVRPEDTSLIKVYKQHHFKVITNPNYRSGMSSSIRVGIENAKPNHHIMVCLGDMPFIKAASYQSILTAFFSHPALMCRPIFKSQDGETLPGHPVIFSQDAKPLLLTLNGDTGAQTMMRSLSNYKLALNDIGVVSDIDRVSDLPDDSSCC